MILRSDRFNEKVSPYVRPNFPYVCGRAAAWGKPCLKGPTVNGTCGGVAECQPYNDGSRWVCRRPLGAGGPCTEGPLPDGACAHTHAACQPRKSLRKIRGRISVIVFGIVISAIAAFGFGFGDHEHLVSSLDAGPLSSVHQNFTSEAGCGACHAAHGAGPGEWIKAAFSSSGPSASCTSCHQFGNPVNGPHNSAQIASTRPIETACTMCHTEHKGENANLTTISNEQCHTCHQTKFASFAMDHPEFSETYPFKRRTAIAFNHTNHFNQHFKNARYQDRVPSQGCVSCHNLEVAERTVPVRGFEETCAGCHSDNITNRPFVLFTFPELEENPFDVQEVVRSRGLFADDREEAHENISELSDKLVGSSGAALAAAAAQLRVTALLGVNAGKKAAIQALAERMVSNTARLEGLDLSGDAKDLVAEIKEPASAFVSHATKALNELTEETYEALEEAIEELEEKVESLAETIASEQGKVLTADTTTVLTLLSDRLGDLEADEEFEPVSSETLSPAAAALMGVDGEEVEEYAEAVENLVSGILEDGVEAIASLVEEAEGNPDIKLHGLSNEVVGSAAAAWAANREYEALAETIERGWYATEFSLIYNPPAHADPVMKAWIDFAAAKGSDTMRDALLSRSEGAGACTKCHAVSNVKSEDSGGSTSALRVEWKSSQENSRPLNQYQHKPHINLLGPGTWCSSCHKINDKAAFDEAYKQTDPHKFASNFNSVGKNTCTECHGGGQVSQQCLLCHKYHQEPGFAKTMMPVLTKAEGRP